MLKRCNECGLQDCNCSFSSAEEELKESIKSSYLESADRFRTKQGLANFIWRQLFNAKVSEKKAWDEKQSSIAKISTRHASKYEPIIEQKDKEIDYQSQLIKKLQGMLASSDPASNKADKEKRKGCNGCGSTTGCYCK
jgi:hypothetical protein